MPDRKSIPGCPGQMSIFDIEAFTCDIFGNPAKSGTAMRNPEKTVPRENTEEQGEGSSGENHPQEPEVVTLANSSLEVQASESVLEELLVVIDSIPLRPARQICGSLEPKIPQKMNGSDRSLKELRDAIKQRLWEQPTAVPFVQQIVAQAS